MKFSASSIALLAAVAFCLAGVSAQEGTRMIANNPVTTAAPGRDWSPLFYYEFDDKIREIFVEMESNAADGGDPDLYIKFGSMPTLDSYDARDYSPNHVDFASLRYIPSTPGKLFLRVHSYFNRTSNIKLTVRAFSCRNRDCGGAAQGTCNAATGTCTCVKPVDNRPYCTAKVVELTLTNFYVIHTASMDHEDEQLYKWEIAEPLPVNIEFHVSREKYDGSMRFYLQRGHAPNPATGDYIKSTTMQSLAHIFNAPQAELNTGVYYLSIVADKTTRQTVTIGPKYHQCPNSCSEHGNCNWHNNTCTCERGYRSSPDCAVFHNNLENHHPINLLVPPFTGKIFSFGISDVVAAAASDVVVRVRTHPTAIYPSILIKHGSRPAANNYDYRSPVPSTNHSSVKIAHTDAKEGEYYVVVNNDAAVFVNSTVHFDIHGYCSPKCFEHGTCDDLGRCNCHAGWVSADCSMAAGAGGGDSGVSVGILVVCIFLFLFVGMGAGILIYRYCSKRQTGPTGNDSIQDQAYLRT